MDPKANLLEHSLHLNYGLLENVLSIIRRVGEANLLINLQEVAEINRNCYRVLRYDAILPPESNRMRKVCN